MSELTFSHIEARFVGAVACPDCYRKLGPPGNVLMDVETHLLCTECGASFQYPKVELERLPSEDYTHGSPDRDKPENTR